METGAGTGIVEEMMEVDGKGEDGTLNQGGLGISPKRRPRRSRKAKAPRRPEPEPKKVPQRELDRLPMREEILALREKEATDKATMTELRQELAERLEVHGADSAKITMLTEAGQMAMSKTNQMEARAWQSGC